MPALLCTGSPVPEVENEASAVECVSSAISATSHTTAPTTSQALTRHAAAKGVASAARPLRSDAAGAEPASARNDPRGNVMRWIVLQRYSGTGVNRRASVP